MILLIRKIYNTLFNLNNHHKNDSLVLINHGKINFHNLINNKYSYIKLIKLLNRKGYKDLSKIDYCILYNNEILVFNSDFKYPLSLIIDGKILNNNLLHINKDITWLENNINKNNLILKNIDYAFYKDKKIYFLTN